MKATLSFLAFQAKYTQTCYYSFVFLTRSWSQVATGSGTWARQHCWEAVGCSGCCPLSRSSAAQAGTSHPSASLSCAISRDLPKPWGWRYSLPCPGKEAAVREGGAKQRCHTCQQRQGAESPGPPAPGLPGSAASTAAPPGGFRLSRTGAHPGGSRLSHSPELKPERAPSAEREGEKTALFTGPFSKRFNNTAIL